MCFIDLLNSNNVCLSQKHGCFINYALYTVDHFIFAWWNFRENRTWHYFAKWWIREQRLSRIYDSLVKPEVGFSLFLCLFILSRKRFIYSDLFPLYIIIHVLVSAYIRDCYEISLSFALCINGPFHDAALVLI